MLSLLDKIYYSSSDNFQVSTCIFATVFYIHSCFNIILFLACSNYNYLKLTGIISNALLHSNSELYDYYFKYNNLSIQSLLHVQCEE